ncbi:MAG: phage minor head protein [Vibrio sp.]
MSKPDATSPVVPKAALDYLSRKKLKPGFNHAEVWQQEHAAAFTVAKMTETDLLAETHALLVQSIAQGKTFADFQRELRPQLMDRGWWGRQERVNPGTGKAELVQLGSNQRLKTIYQTNLRTAHAAGNWQRIERNQQTHPYLVYELGAAQEHRQEHMAWHGLVLPVDDKFWDTHYPLNGWGCKCRVRQINQAGLDKLKRDGITSRTPELDNNGLPTGRFTQHRQAIGTKAPKVSTRELVNKHTGEVMKVPRGIDAGWDYNAGKAAARTEAASKQLATKQKKLSQAFSQPLDVRQVPAIYSSAKNVSTDKLAACLKSLPAECQPQLDQLFAFLGDKQTKSLFIKASEMSLRAKAAMQAESSIGGYLDRPDVKFVRALYSHKAPSKIGGFTSVSWEHVVIKVKSTANLSKVNIPALRSVVSDAIERHAAGSPAYTYSAMLGEHDALITTWLHEIAHQVHYYAGAPRSPVGSKFITRYSNPLLSEHEYHAEHFVAWLLDRDAFLKYDPVGTQHIDAMVQAAIKNAKSNKKR